MSGRAKRVAGRPAGNESTRSTILDAARRAFGATGYEGASLRAIAADVGVDGSTVIHFFGSKEGLFRAVVADLAQVTRPLVDAFARKASGAELAATYLGIWEDDASGAAMRAIVRTAIGSDKAIALMQGVMMQAVLDAIRSDDRLDAEMAVMHLIGLGLGRYIVRLPELAGASIETIAQRIGPTLDRYLGSLNL